MPSPAISALQPAIVSFLLTNLTFSFGFSFFMKHTSDSPGTFLGQDLPSSPALLNDCFLSLSVTVPKSLAQAPRSTPREDSTTLCVCALLLARTGRRDSCGQQRRGGHKMYCRQSSWRDSSRLSTSRLHRRREHTQEFGNAQAMCFDALEDGGHAALFVATAVAATTTTPATTTAEPAHALHGSESILCHGIGL